MPPSDIWRAPRLRVLANGVPVARATEASVVSAGAFSADFFRVRAALAGDAAEWAALTAVVVDVQMALDPLGGFTSVVQGRADAIGIDPIAGTLTLEGRDYAAQLIEARTQETFANRTSSEIAVLLAGRHNLAADVQATDTPVGRYWELEHDSLTLNAGTRATTEWDLLATLAGWEGFDLWVAGTTLCFRPPDTTTLPPVLSAVATPTGPANFVALRLERALSFAGNISVTVKSWHSRAGTGTVQTAATDRGAAGGAELRVRGAKSDARRGAVAGTAAVGGTGGARNAAARGDAGRIVAGSADVSPARRHRHAVRPRVACRRGGATHVRA